jgi:hypothetical protein
VVCGNGWAGGVGHVDWELAFLMSKSKLNN